MLQLDPPLSFVISSVFFMTTERVRSPSKSLSMSFYLYLARSPYLSLFLCSTHPFHAHLLICSYALHQHHTWFLRYNIIYTRHAITRHQLRKLNYCAITPQVPQRTPQQS